MCAEAPAEVLIPDEGNSKALLTAGLKGEVFSGRNVTSPENSRNLPIGSETSQPVINSDVEKDTATKKSDARKRIFIRW
jgi:hypothetical protein